MPNCVNKATSLLLFGRSASNREAHKPAGRHAIVLIAISCNGCNFSRYRRPRSRQTLYGEFINECSAPALDSFENTLEKSERLLSIYALLNRIRICASDAVLYEAERALASITEQYFSPNLSLEQLHALVRAGSRSDPLRSFAEACRAEVRSMPAAF
jgi:hypothetical protein